MENTMSKATTNMRRIRKGDTFNHNGMAITCAGIPQHLSDGRVKVPVVVDGNSRISRRTFAGDLRVAIS
jgi:hypothetical protein